jgi:hypothetical protein
MNEQFPAKKGFIQVSAGLGQKNVNVGLARDNGRVYSRPGAGWVDLHPDIARRLAETLIAAAAEAEGKSG